MAVFDLACSLVPKRPNRADMIGRALSEQTLVGPLAVVGRLSPRTAQRRAASAPPRPYLSTALRGRNSFRLPPSFLRQDRPSTNGRMRARDRRREGTGRAQFRASCQRCRWRSSTSRPAAPPTPTPSSPSSSKAFRRCRKCRRSPRRRRCSARWRRRRR